MKDFRNNLQTGWSLAVKIILCAMAVAAGLYVRGLLAKEEVICTKEVHSAHTVSHDPYLYTMEAEDEKTDTVLSVPFNYEDLSTLLQQAVQNGSQMLDSLSTTLLESEFGKTLFDEEERKNLKDLSNLSVDLIEKLLEQADSEH